MRSALLLFGIHLVFAGPVQVNIRCANVTGSLGEVLTLTCSVYIPRDACCIVMYKFRKTTSDDDQTICKKGFSYKHCTELTSFSCPYTAYAGMTTKFKFFLQATCGHETAEFTLDIKESNIMPRKNSNVMTKEENKLTELLTVTAGCALALTVSVAIMGVIVWMRSSQVKRPNLPGYVTGRTMDTDSMSDEQVLVHSSGSMDHPAPSF